MRLSGFLVLTLVLAGCGTPGGHTKTTEKAGSPDILRPGDAVYISFSGVIDPPQRVEDRIREDGCITIPFYPAVEAAGLTRLQLQQKVLDLYVPKYYKRLTVTVNPAERWIYVSGQVRKEGGIPYAGELTVLKAIAAAGGFTDFARKNRVRLTRANGQIINVDCDRALQEPTLDLPLFPGDQVYVPRRLI